MIQLRYDTELYDFETVEENISADFDDQIAPWVFEQYGRGDGPAFCETFNNWTDGLCKDGEISDETYDKIVYVGKYEEGK
jgi:hypothetical protein